MRFEAAGVAELAKVMAAGRKVTLEQFLRRIRGAKGAWVYRRSECPKLVEVIKRLQAWNNARPKAAQDVTWRQRDEELSAAAAAEFFKLQESGETLTTRALLKRIGGWAAWKHAASDIPKLTDVVRRFQSWNASVRVRSPLKAPSRRRAACRRSGC
ncbi:hypothetical protein [Variovorax sp. J22R115]|uniref:hypothetical protein n=1 Tax=Variovorax sp. J22R115 TaxID=3053509 RepID=UPI002576AF31|nr:hypothetical protein [Variovorax sp. J22R115]MDM0053738.1 hypothetical protein [Variovorax sp. J22R115]